MPPEILAPFFPVKFVDEVRRRAVLALANGWPAEPEVRAVLLALAQDVSEYLNVQGAAATSIRDVLPKFSPATSPTPDA